MEYWKHGERSLLAKSMKFDKAHLYAILRRERGVSPQRAKDLEKTSEEVLGKRIPWAAWLFNKKTKHPAFFGDSITE